MQNFKCLQNAFNMALKTNSQFRVGDWTVKPVDDETISVKYLNRQIAKISTSEYSNYAELKLFSLYQRLGEDSPAFLYTVCKACKDFGIEIWCDDFFQWGRYDFELPQAGGAVIPFGSHDIKRLEILSDDKHVATITPALLGSLCRSECAFAFNDDVLKGVLLFQKADTSETEVVSADIARKYIEKLACEQELSFEC